MKNNQLFLDIVKNPDTVKHLHIDKIIKIINNVKDCLKNEDALLELKGNVAFVGDTHGDLYITRKIIENFFHLDHIIFLGDYIDREPQKWGAIYNIIYLLSLKSLYPNKIILLKGNHESNYIVPCYPYEFKNELVKKYGSDRLHSYFETVFSNLPLTSIVNDSIFTSHGGIIKNKNRAKLKSLSKNNKKAIISLVWADPSYSPVHLGVGSPFSQKELINFLHSIDAEVFIRGHNQKINGFSIYNDKCLTIFSSRKYRNEGNQGILVAESKEARVQSIEELTLWNYVKGNWRRYKPLKK